MTEYIECYSRLHINYKVIEPVINSGEKWYPIVKRTMVEYFSDKECQKHIDYSYSPIRGSDKRIVEYFKTIDECEEFIKENEKVIDSDGIVQIPKPHDSFKEFLYIHRQDESWFKYVFSGWDLKNIFGLKSPE